MNYRKGLPVRCLRALKEEDHGIESSFDFECFQRAVRLRMNVSIRTAQYVLGTYMQYTAINTAVAETPCHCRTHKRDFHTGLSDAI